MVPNPEYLTWYQHDQLVVSYITSTLSEPILALTVGHDTAKAVWDCLEEHFSQNSIANAANLRFQLLDLHKGTRSVTEFLQHAKNLADELAHIGQPVSNNDLVLMVFWGLGPDYRMLLTAVINSKPLPSFTELHAQILAFDLQNPNGSTSSTTTQTALITTHPPTPSPWKSISSTY